LGVGIGHPESITTYRQPYATMVDQLDAGGVPADRRILAALVATVPSLGTVGRRQGRRRESMVR
jgi:hypothetical protein